MIYYVAKRKGAKMKTLSKPRKYACFTPEQQEAYEKLNAQRRLYVDYRGQGNNKAQSYIMAGYAKKGATQASYLLEKTNKVVAELIETLQKGNRARQLTKAESELNDKIDALATQQGVEQALEVIDNADGETARRIQFYRDVINGKVKTVKKTVRKNAEGGIIDTKIEEISDVAVKMQARKELDKILGLNQLPDLGALQMGDITIHIVDASKKDELADSRNQVFLNPDDVQEQDGEDVIVVEEKEENANGTS